MGAVQRRVRHRIFWTTDRHTVVRMLNSPGNNGHSLGLSVGATNLAGTRDGQTAVIRPAELTLRGQRLTGFVDRVGDPVPLIAPDGSKTPALRAAPETHAPPRAPERPRPRATCSKGSLRSDVSPQDATMSRAEQALSESYWPVTLDKLPLSNLKRGGTRWKPKC